jgi:hypothetical protein
MILKKLIEEIDLSALGALIVEDEFRGYFLSEPGKEHYRILAFFSLLYRNSILIDIGTYKGCSALALSYNQSNKVISFDLVNALKLSATPDNVVFVVDKILDAKYRDMIMASPFIALDTNHNGIFENRFYQLLERNNWRGKLFLDDIHLNDAMKKFWSGVDREKYDLTEYGHRTGTGLVIFK